MSCPAVEIVSAIHKANENRIDEICNELSDMGAMPLVEELLAIRSQDFAAYAARTEAATH